MRKYSLANYILSITPNDPQINTMFGTISVGGEGSYLDDVSISMSETMFSTESYATGAWVHNKNLARNGSVTVSLNQLSDTVARFKQMCKTFYAGDYEGFTITLSTNNAENVATCIDCLITKIPDQSFGESAGKQTWTFTAGQISFD